ncbi:MAG: hypothetical protein HQM04_11805 [Magnetococcales bacterium]|nr:hypothetical protein [Magnetococcales bacterium]MBF0115710.1 hypothetical protein [Magnetococcales bacterium]
MEKAKLPSQDDAQVHIARVWDYFITKIVPGEVGAHFAQGVVLLDEKLLTEAVLDALSDYARMVSFHLPNGSSPDRHKHAGFFSKWIAKVRPLHIDWEKFREISGWASDKHNSHLVTKEKSLLMINAHFALCVFRSFLLEDLPQPIQEHVLYAFQFRELSGEYLALIAYASEEITRLERVNAQLLNASALPTPTDADQSS